MLTHTHTHTSRKSYELDLFAAQRSAKISFYYTNGPINNLKRFPLKPTQTKYLFFFVLIPTRANQFHILPTTAHISTYICITVYTIRMYMYMYMVWLSVYISFSYIPIWRTHTQKTRPNTCGHDARGRHFVYTIHIPIWIKRENRWNDDDPFVYIYVCGVYKNE